MTISSFYMPHYVLDALNTGVLDPSDNFNNYYVQLAQAVRGKIKLIKFSFENFEPSQLNSANSILATMVPEESYLELTTGEKYHVGVANPMNFRGWHIVNLINFSIVNNNLTMDITNLEYWSFTINDPFLPSGLNAITINQNSAALTLSEVAYNQSFIARYNTTSPSSLVFSSTPVIWSAGNGGGNSSTSPSMYNGKVVGNVSNNPTQVEFLYNGQPIPEGSVLRFNGQKFLKVSGGSMEFVAIEVMPKSEWGWDSSADADWAILQNM